MSPGDSSAARWQANRKLGLLFAGLAGAGVVLSFAPFGITWIAPLCLAMLVLFLEVVNARQAWWLSYSFGFGMFAAGTYWLYISLNILGGLWPPIAVLLMLALILALAAYVGLSGYVAVRLAPAGGWPRWLIVFPAAWVFFEWLRGWLFTGFPWMSIGYGQVETPLGALAPVGGVHAVSWATLVIAGLTVAVVRCAWQGRLAAITAVAAILLTMQPLMRTVWVAESGGDFNVSLVQGAIPQEIKWSAAQLEPTLSLYRRLTLEQGGQDLIVWPEAAITALPNEVEAFVSELHTELVARDTQLLTGILTFDAQRGQYLNTLWALGAEPGAYYKRHLVLFGEYFPLPDFAKRWLRIMRLPSESIGAGDELQPLLIAKGVPVAASICFELAFAAELRGSFPAAEVLVNVSNDAWFGNSIAPHQHVQIGQMRAREMGRYLLRATNTGISAVIDPQGGIIATIPQFEPGVVRATIRPFSGATPFVRFGNWPVIGLASFCLLAALAVVRRAAA